MNANEKIDRLIDLTARAESKGDYSAWVENDNCHGPSFGLIQFQSTTGSLGKLLGLMAKAKPAWFRLVFGCMPGDMAAFAHEIADDPEFYKDRLQLSGQVPIWQKCQRDLARTEYFDPAAKLCASYHLDSERAHAVAFDIAVQYGVRGLSEMMATFCVGREAEALKRLANAADTHAYDANRRHKLLQSRELSDEPMFPKPACSTCGGSGGVDCGDVSGEGDFVTEPCPDCTPRATETRPTLRRGDSSMEVNRLLKLLLRMHGEDTSHCGGMYFGPRTEATVKSFQEARGLVADGICGPATWAALDQAAKEGGGTNGR